MLPAAHRTTPPSLPLPQPLLAHQPVEAGSNLRCHGLDLEPVLEPLQQHRDGRAGGAGIQCLRIARQGCMHLRALGPAPGRAPGCSAPAQHGRLAPPRPWPSLPVGAPKPVGAPGPESPRPPSGAPGQPRSPRAPGGRCSPALVSRCEGMGFVAGRWRKECGESMQDRCRQGQMHAARMHGPRLLAAPLGAWRTRRQTPHGSPAACLSELGPAEEECGRALAPMTTVPRPVSGPVSALLGAHAGPVPSRDNSTPLPKKNSPDNSPCCLPAPCFPALQTG